MPKKTATRKKPSTRAGKQARVALAPETKLAEYRRKRDFSRTAEPEGGGAGARHSPEFVIQKHAASHLHYDLRLEHDGVMKSWAVPKGPSLDPSVKRLAMQVEDHPIEYNKFEGTIPAGEYGGGTVMLWDGGPTYGGSNPDPEEGIRRGLKKGDFKFVLNGKRLKVVGVGTHARRRQPGKPQWLLIKHGTNMPRRAPMSRQTTRRRWQRAAPWRRSPEEEPRCGGRTAKREGGRRKGSAELRLRTADGQAEPLTLHPI